MVVRAVRPGRKWDRRIGEQQVAPPRDELVAGMVKDRTLARLLVQPDPVLPVSPLDLGHSSRDLERAGLASQAYHMLSSPARRTRVKRRQIFPREVPGDADRAFAPLLAPVCEAVSFANMIDCANCGCYRSLARRKPRPRWYRPRSLALLSCSGWRSVLVHVPAQ